MYVAIPVSNPGMPLLSIVRLAVPLTDVDRQLAWVRTLALLGFATGIVAAIALTWAFSVPLGRRLRSMQQRVEQYATGDLSRPAPDYTDDEVGTIARLLDRLAQDFAQRLAGLEADRARMEAILAGMIEGVLVVERARTTAARQRRGASDAPDRRGGGPPLSGNRPAASCRRVRSPTRSRGRPTESVELTELRESAAIADRAYALRSRASPARGAVVVLHDITDLRRADQIRRDFVANVSHELRTPLTAVRGYVEALADADPEESRRFLEIVVAPHDAHGAARARSAAARPARRRAGAARAGAVLGRQPVRRRRDRPVARSARRAARRVERAVDPDAATVTGDPAKLQDALRNLLENAINYAPEGSTIVMRRAAACADES